MHRRAILQWISCALGTLWAAAIAVPAVSCLLGPRRRRGGPAIAQRVAPLDDLPVGQPAQRTVTGQRRDAWTVHPQAPIGRVWLVRRSGAGTPHGEAQVDAFSAVCPHLGCVIGFQAADGNFVCPCHRATFDLSGAPVSGEKLGHKNPAPRGMDALTCRVVQDEDAQQWWVEVEYRRFEQGLNRKVEKS